MDLRFMISRARKSLGIRHNMKSFDIRYFHIISRNVLPHIQISVVKIVTGFYEG